MERRVNLFFSPSDSEIILNTVSRLLEGFQKMYPDAVDEAVAVLRNGRSVEQAGRIIATAVQTAQDQLLQDASGKQKTLRENIFGLRDQLAEQERNLTQVQSTNKSLQDKCNLQATELEDMRETITIQNRILARQQHKLQSLLGNTIEDE